MRTKSKQFYQTNHQEWECDGCNRVIPREPGDTELCDCQHHQGWMMVGGVAWTSYHDDNIHPMQTIIEQIKQILPQSNH